MAKAIRIRAVQRDEVDVDMFVSGLLLLLEQLATDSPPTESADEPPEEPAP